MISEKKIFSMFSLYKPIKTGDPKEDGQFLAPGALFEKKC